MSVLGVVITDGVGFRNFVLSDFLSESQNQFDSVVIFSCLPKSAFKDFENKFKIIELEVFNEKFPTWFLRKTKEVAHLQHFAQDFFGINDSLNGVKKAVLILEELQPKLFYNGQLFLIQKIGFNDTIIGKNYHFQIISLQKNILNN